MAPQRNRHDWLPEERDAIKILFNEYNLDAGRDGEAYDIFAALFHWNHNRGRIRDEWRSRWKGGKSPSWRTVHDKALRAYTVEEQTRRAGVRVRVLRAGQDLDIALIPEAEFVGLHADGIATLGNGSHVSAGTATMTASSALIATPFQSTGKSAVNGSGIIASLTASTSEKALEPTITDSAVASYTQSTTIMPVSTGASSKRTGADDLTDQASSTGPPPVEATISMRPPPRPVQEDEDTAMATPEPSRARVIATLPTRRTPLESLPSSFSGRGAPNPGASLQQLGPSNTTASREGANSSALSSGYETLPSHTRALPPVVTPSTEALNHAGEEQGDADLWMAHYIDIHRNPHFTGPGPNATEPRYHCARSCKFRGGEHSAFAFGGHVMRIISDADILTGMPRSQEDVMVCSRDYCEMCFDTNWGEELRGESPTFGLPFVHISECRVGDKGVLDFTPDLWREYEDGADCKIERERVRFFHDGQSAVVLSAVCIAESCIRCSPDRTVIPTADDYVSGRKKDGDHSKKDGPPEGPREPSAGDSQMGGSRDDSADPPPAKSTRSSTRAVDKGKGRAHARTMVPVSSIASTADETTGRARTKNVLPASSQGSVGKTTLRSADKAKCRTDKLSTVPKLLSLGGPKPLPRQAPIPETGIKKLPMVHFMDLAHRNDIPNSRYQALHSHKFMDDSPAYQRGGQIYIVYFYASKSLPARFEDVTICWDRACETCSSGFADSSAAPPGGLPFVHLASDTYSLQDGPPNDLYFQLEDPLRGLEWDTSDISRAGERIMTCSSGGEKINVGVEVCDLDLCRRCHPDDVDTRSTRVKAVLEKKKADWNARQKEVYLARGMSATGPDYRPLDERRDNPDPKPMLSPQEVNALRMCHFKHLEFGENFIRFDSRGRSPFIVDQYFVPEASEIYASSGMVYSVNFPDGTTRDVMCCVPSSCAICTEPGFAQHIQVHPYGGEGLVHRREIDMDPMTNLAAFIPESGKIFEVLDAEVEFEEDMVAFQGEDGQMRETGCRVCVEGTFGECDEWQDGLDALEEDE